MKKVIIASQNPVKIEATKIAFKKMFSDQEFEFEGVSAESGVSDQPMSDEETLKGALNRAENASRENSKADYWVGIEGGLEEHPEGMMCFAWMAIKNVDGKIGYGKSSTFFLPNEVTKLVKEGRELGDADDIVFKRNNSKQANGAVGLLTDNVITRTIYYVDAIIMALIPFKNKELY